MIPRRQFLCFAAALALAASAAPAQNFALHDGDRVVFYGDSITDQRLYTTFAETFVVTRFPKLKVTFVHSGWGGDRVSGGGGGNIQTRLSRDVVPFNPTVVTIMLGMNDGRYRAFDPAIFEEFSTGYAHIVDAIQEHFPNVRITNIVASPYDDVTRPPNFEGGYNQVLVRFGDYVRKLSAGERLGVADFNTPMVAMLAKAKEADAANAAKILPDRVHPSAGGHMVMAEALLKSWNAPAVVSVVELDASKSKPVRETNARISELVPGKPLSWTELDEALPMPIDPKDPLVALVMRSSDFVAALDQELLRITGLAAGRYTLKIDSEAAGEFTAEQLAEGINLATLATPMARQAAEVHALTLRHNNLHFARWRQVQVPMEKDPAEHLQAALAALDTLEADIVKEQRAAAQPKPHHFEIIPQ